MFTYRLLSLTPVKISYPQEHPHGEVGQVLLRAPGTTAAATATAASRQPGKRAAAGRQPRAVEKATAAAEVEGSVVGIGEERPPRRRRTQPELGDGVHGMANVVKKRCLTTHDPVLFDNLACHIQAH